MWPFLIGLAVSVVKTFATSAASAAGTKVGELMFTRVGANAQQVVVAGSQAGASREQQLSATQQLLAALKTDAAFRDEVRSILATHAPEALATGEQVQKQLEVAPQLAEEVVAGARPVTDFLDEVYLWNQMGPPVSPDQAFFLRSPLFHRLCPIGREDLGFAPETMGAVDYENNFLGDTQKVRLPTGLLPGPPGGFSAVCTHGHRWPVFAS